MYVRSVTIYIKTARRFPVSCPLLSQLWIFLHVTCIRNRYQWKNSLLLICKLSLSLSPVNCLKTVHPKVSKLISHADSQMVASKRRPKFPWFFGLLPKPFPRVLCKEGWEDGGTCPKASWLMKGFSYQQQLHIIPFINGMGAAEKARGDSHSVTDT